MEAKGKIIGKNMHLSYKKGQCTQKTVQLRSNSNISFQVKVHERVRRCGSAVKDMHRLGQGCVFESCELRSRRALAKTLRLFPGFDGQEGQFVLMSYSEQPSLKT
jgi:hypothetical protein